MRAAVWHNVTAAPKDYENALLCREQKERNTRRPFFDVVAKLSIFHNSTGHYSSPCVAGGSGGP